MAIRPSPRLTRNRIGLLIGLALILLAAIGETLGWWRDWGLILAAVGIVLSIWYGVDTASETTIRQLHEPIERMAGDMATVKLVLERTEPVLAQILHVLDARLPPPSAR
jgi:hypothetical protein